MRVAESQVQDRGNPFLWNDDDVDLPPLLFALIDVVAKGEDVVVLIDDFVGPGPRAVEAAPKGMLRVGLLPRALLRTRNHFGDPLCHTLVFPLRQGGVLLHSVKRLRHERRPKKERDYTRRRLGGATELAQGAQVLGEARRRQRNRLRGPSRRRLPRPG